MTNVIGAWSMHNIMKLSPNMSAQFICACGCYTPLDIATIAASPRDLIATLFLSPQTQIYVLREDHYLNFSNIRNMESE
jgi:hypothetical protein